MDEDHWRQHAGHDVAPINQFVEVIEFAGVMEREEDKGNQAKNVEVLCFVCGTALKVNKKSNRQVAKPNETQVVE